MTKEWLNDEFLNATLCERQMENPFPYEDNFFDAVISIQAIHHNLMKNIRKTISEIERVLKPGGVLFVTFPVLRSRPVSEEDVSVVSRIFRELRRRQMSRNWSMTLSSSSADGCVVVAGVVIFLSTPDQIPL